MPTISPNRLPRSLGEWGCRRGGEKPFPWWPSARTAERWLSLRSTESLVKLYSARDGAPLKRMNRVGPGQTRDSSGEALEIEPQAELTALALGPNNSLATAGNTPGGVAVRIWDLDSPSSQTSLNPAQSETRMMRFSPQGNLLAIVGSGPIELWDPVALNPVAVLAMSDQATDVAFAPDGRTLAAVSRAGASTLWTIHDSAARTQLSGFENPPMTLAFSGEGLLAGVGWNGEIWSWRNGRCPEIGPPSPVPPGSTSVTSTASMEPRRSAASGAEGQRSKGRSREGEGPRPSRRFSPVSVAFDDTGRMVLHDVHGLRVYHSGSTPAESPPAFQISAPPLTGFGFGTSRTSDGKIIALVRSANIYLWRAQSPNELLPVSLPVRQIAEPPRNGPRRQPPGPGEPQSSEFRSAQIAPGGKKLYTVEPAQGFAERPSSVGDRHDVTHERRRSPRAQINFVSRRYDQLRARARRRASRRRRSQWSSGFARRNEARRPGPTEKPRQRTGGLCASFSGVLAGRHGARRRFRTRCDIALVAIQPGTTRTSTAAPGTPEKG